MKLNPIGITYLYIFVSGFFWLLAGINEYSRLFVYSYLLSPTIFFLFAAVTYRSFTINRFTFVPVVLIVYCVVSFLLFTPYWLSIDNLAALYRLLIFPVVFLFSYRMFLRTDRNNLIDLIITYAVVAILSKIILINFFNKSYGGGANQIVFMPIYVSIFILIWGRKQNSFNYWHTFKPIFGRVIFFLIFGLVLLSFKRMGIVLMFMSLIAFVIYFRKNKQMWFFNILFCCIIAASLQYIDLENLISRLLTIVEFLKNRDSDNSGNLRVMENISVFTTLQSTSNLSFLTGIGPGAAYDAVTASLKINASGRTVDVHSMYFYLLLNTGLLGLFLYITIPLMLVFEKLSSLKITDINQFYLSIGVKITIIFQFINGITSNAFFGNAMLALLCGWLASVSKDQDQKYDTISN